jgi:hypothetical protein
MGTVAFRLQGIKLDVYPNGAGRFAAREFLRAGARESGILNDDVESHSF